MVARPCKFLRRAGVLVHSRGVGTRDWDGIPPDADCLVAWHDDESVTYVPEPSLVLGLGLLRADARPRVPPPTPWFENRMGC